MSVCIVVYFARSGLIQVGNTLLFSGWVITGLSGKGLNGYSSSLFRSRNVYIIIMMSGLCSYCAIPVTDIAASMVLIERMSELG
ncbi:hypothetical protein ACH42_17695 [Endozoicomonas sp. (ex Bugula neritina AB1)]|nr:hypothetical protein ACH42_17695 [Endozoicomonas sp. (ex Bugula neritina AB1)]